jgi:membrane associated rhomboid family serine protease
LKFKFSEVTITIAIVIITCLVSFTGFTQPKVIDDLIFYPPAVSERRQYYRFISHGFIHADVLHLVFNMIALYSFGTIVEKVFTFSCIFDKNGKLFYLLLYFTALIIASLPDYFKFKDAYHFRSLGASGAVSAVIFSSIIFTPQSGISLFMLPIPIPGFIFGILYLGFSFYLDRRGGGKINHSAHFWGAAYGVIFTLVCCQLFSHGFDVYDNFMQQIHSLQRILPIVCND